MGIGVWSGQQYIYQGVGSWRVEVCGFSIESIFGFSNGVGDELVDSGYCCSDGLECEIGIRFNWGVLGDLLKYIWF